jgi:trans-aconitate methyltransferase
MSYKPRQFARRYASIFQDPSVVSAYRHRPPYPAETFRILLSLIPLDITRNVLDAGCGTGFIARLLAAHVDRVDAVDISRRMIAMARTLPGGDYSNINWIAASIETAPLSGPYALIVSAASLHWMDWEQTLPRFAKLIVPGGLLALVEEIHSPNPWDRQAVPILGRYSMNKDFAPYSMATIAAELEQRYLFQLHGQVETTQVPFHQSVEDYIQAFHARNGFSLDRMDPRAAAQFDAELRSIVEPFCPQGVVEQHIATRVLWGRPLPGKAA